MNISIYTCVTTFFLGLGVFFVHFPEKAEARVGEANVPPVPYYIASKNGEVFGFPWCGSMPRIKSENIVILSHENDAFEQGFRPMKGCRGLSENP